MLEFIKKSNHKGKFFNNEMTGIVFDIKRFTVHDGPGIRATVFLKGCHLRCSWCHNPEGIAPLPCHAGKTLKLNGKNFTKDEIIGYEISADMLFAELDKERIFMEESGGGVTFSGGEPLLQHEFLIEMLKICKANSMHTAVDTSLFASWKITEAVSYLADLFLVDLKLMDSAAHQFYTGEPNDLILENLRKLSSSEASIVIRIPLIPGVTDSTGNIRRTVSFLQTLNGKIREVNLLPFHQTANEKYKRTGRENPFAGIKPLKKEKIKDIEKRITDAGFFVKTGG